MRCCAGICAEQIQSRKQALDHAGYAGPHPATWARSPCRSGMYLSAPGKFIEHDMEIDDLSV